MDKQGLSTETKSVSSKDYANPISVDGGLAAKEAYVKGGRTPKRTSVLYNPFNVEGIGMNSISMAKTDFVAPDFSKLSSSAEIEANKVYLKSSHIHMGSDEDKANVNDRQFSISKRHFADPATIEQGGRVDGAGSVGVGGKQMMSRKNEKFEYTLGNTITR